MKNSKSLGYYYLGSFLSALAILFFAIYFMPILGVGDEGLGRALESPIFWVIALFILIVPPIAAVIFAKKRQKLDTEDFINLFILRYVVGFMMFFYGWAKMHGKFFDITYLTQDSRVSDVGSFELTWYYFGRNNVQEFIIGLLEFIPGLLILFRRWTFIAAAIMLPVSLNVLMVNTFNHISGLTFPASIFVAAGNLYILYSYKDKIRSFLSSVEDASKPVLATGLRIPANVFKGLVLLTIGIMFFFGVYNNLFAGREKSVLYNNKFRGGFELQSLEVNHKTVIPQTGENKYYKNIYLEPQMRWNCVLTFEKEFHPRAITIKWNPKNDSVKTYLKKHNDVTLGEVDSTTAFSGTYKLANNKMYVNGIQNKDTISAIYYKKDLRDYTWFW